MIARWRRHSYTLAPLLPPELLAIAHPLHQALHELNQPFDDRVSMAPAPFENLPHSLQDQVRRRAEQIARERAHVRDRVQGAP